MRCGEAAVGAGLRERHRAGQRARLAGQDLQVVVQHQVLVPGCHQPRVCRHRPGALEDGQLVRGQPDPHRRPDQPGRHRVAALADADPRELVRPGPQCRPGVEPVGRQRPQQRGLLREVGRHRVRPELDVPPGVAQIVLGQPGVQVRQRPHPRDGDQEIPPEPADLALDAALLMSPADAGLAVESVETVPGPERQPAGVLLPVPALQHLAHRRRQVVVADVRRRHPARHRERGHVPLQQRLLRARGIDPVHAQARERQPVGEQLAGRVPAVHRDRDRPEVDLGLRPRLLRLRHEPLQALRLPLLLRLDLRAAPRHVLRHVGVRRMLAMLIGQPRPGPPGGMPLLARRVQVLDQHRVDQRGHRVPRGRRPLRDLPRGRHRRRQRLPHRPPVHPVLPGDRPDPHPLPTVLPDRSEQCHPVPSHPPSVSGKQQNVTTIRAAAPKVPQPARRVAGTSPTAGAK